MKRAASTALEHARNSELHHRAVLGAPPSRLPLAREAAAATPVCLSRKRNVPAYRKQEQSNSTLPADWMSGMFLVRRVVLVPVSTRERLVLRTAPPPDFVLKSTNTLALLRATWREGQILSPAKASQERMKRSHMRQRQRHVSGRSAVHRYAPIAAMHSADQKSAIMTTNGSKVVGVESQTLDGVVSTQVAHLLRQQQPEEEGGSEKKSTPWD
ncbi:hypothetical protein EYF80_010683 [Liparis tanakae]|uniref:Uncharacterized protein n=1 Tax=Liparis tanakae TaxID=230148 RepID=A0A4Z2INE5_9TELE|nr:hypothetical protein EYF80_010683 [Liparis tanakae]